MLEELCYCLLALGTAHLPENDFTPYGDADKRQCDLWAAEGLAVSRGTMYNDMPTNLGADVVASCVPNVSSPFFAAFQPASSKGRTH